MPMTPDQVRATLDKYRWRDGEREEMQRDIAERQAEPDEAGGYEQPRADVIRKQRPIETAQPSAATPTADWVRYIRQQLDKREQSMIGAIADVIAPIEKKHAEALREIATFKAELAELRGEIKMRGALDEVQARLDKIEQAVPARQPLKAISG